MDFFLGPRGHSNFKSGGHLELWQRDRALLSWYQIMGHKGSVYKAKVHHDRKGSNPMLINQSINQSTQCPENHYGVLGG
jgi:hypothetical protein